MSRPLLVRGALMMDFNVTGPRGGAGLRTASRGAGIAVTLAGAAALLGLVTMKAGTASAFALVGASLWSGVGQRPWQPTVARGCATLAALIGILTLVEYAVAGNLRIDQWLVGAPVGASGLSHPGRMSPLTALAFVLLGVALATVERARAVAPGQWMAVAAAYLGLVNLVGHAYRWQGLGGLYSPASAFTEMAVPAAGALVIAGSGVLCARPDRGMMALVTSGGSAGMVVRRLLPATLVLPLVFGWLRLVGERAGVWDADRGWGFLALSVLILFVVIVWHSARALSRTDARRERAETALRHAHDDLELRIQQRTRELRESEQRYRDLVESSRGLICVHDLGGVLLSVNPAAAQLLGYEPSELVGRNLRELLAPAVQDRFVQYLERIRRAPTDAGVMHVVARDGQEQVWAYSNARYEEPGRPPYVLGHAQDITALQRAEEIARQAEALRSVTQLAAAAGHEINNPLLVVVGHLEILRRRSADDPDLLARLEKAAAALDQIRDIVARMQTVTRLERVQWRGGLPPILDLRRSAGAPGEAPAADDRPSA